MEAYNSIEPIHSFDFGKEVTVTIAAITHQQVIDLVRSLPQERLQSLYDFTVFLTQYPLGFTAETDLYGESPAEIEADEARWQQQFSDSRDRLRAMAREAKSEYETGRAKPMKFGPDGRIVR